VEDTAVLEVGDLGVGVESADDVEALAGVGGHSDLLADLEVSAVQVEGELLGAVEAVGVSALTSLELSREHSHTNKVASVNTLVALGNDSLDTLEVGSLGSPIARRARSVLLSSEDDGVDTFIHVSLGSVEDSQLLTTGNMLGGRTDLVDHLVDETDVSEGTASHNLVVTSAGTVRVEVLLLDSLLSEVAGSRGVLGDLTGGGDVIGGDGVSKVKEAVGTSDVLNGLEFSLGALEEGRVVDVGGVFFPIVDLAFGSLKVLPHLAALEDVLVGSLEHLGLDNTVSDGADLLTAGPDLSQENILSLLVLAKRSRLEVEIDGAGESVSNDQRRGGEVVGTGVGMDTTLEVSVSGEDCTSDHVAIDDSVLDAIGDISRVSNAGHATIASSGEAELVEVLRDTSNSKVLRDDVGAGGEGFLDVGRGGETLLDGILGEETSCKHNVGVGGVSAGGDGSNHDISVAEFVILTLVSEGSGSLGVLFSETEALEANLVSHAGVEVGLHVGEVNAIVGALGSSEGSLNTAEVEVHDFSGVGGVLLGAVVLDEHILLSQVLLDELDVALVSAGEAEVVNSVAIDGEVSHGGTVLGSHVGNGGTISESEVLDTRSVELDELADDSALTELLDNSEDQIGGGGVLGEVSVKSETNDLREHHGDSLAKHDGFSLNTTNTPASNAETVNHGGVRVSADNGVGVEETVAVEHGSREVLEVDLMDNTGARGNDAEVIEGLGAPLEELEALAVTNELELLIRDGSVSSAGGIDLDGVIDDEVNGAEGVDLGGVTTEALHSVTHGGEVNDSGDTTKQEVSKYV